MSVIIRSFTLTGPHLVGPFPSPLLSVIFVCSCYGLSPTKPKTKDFSFWETETAESSEVEVALASQAVTKKLAPS